MLELSQKWIRIENRLPIVGMKVLIVVQDLNTRGRSQTVGQIDLIDKGWWTNDGISICRATHWKPLGALPEREGD